MKLSICIAAYNEEGLIGQCLEAARKEIARAGMEEDSEVIVVNNASTDTTRAIALGFPGVRVVDEPRKGLTYARQAGHEASSGDLLACVDADTMLPPGWLDTLNKEFGADEQLVALSGPFVFYDLPPLQRFVSKLFIASYPLAHFFVHRILGAGAILQGGNFVLRRSALEKIGGFDTSIEFYGEDTDIARRVAKLGRVKWTLKFPIYASGRRLSHEGMIKTAWRYTLNFFWTTCTGKPWSSTHLDIRAR